MISQISLFQNTNNGIIMIAVFGVVCLILIGVAIKFMTSHDKKKGENEPKER